MNTFVFLGGDVMFRCSDVVCQSVEDQVRSPVLSGLLDTENVCPDLNGGHLLVGAVGDGRHGVTHCLGKPQPHLAQDSDVIIFNVTRSERSIVLPIVSC